MMDDEVVDLSRYERIVLPGGAAGTILRGEAAGPTVALLGGVHGDEEEGVLAVRQLLKRLAQMTFAGVVKAVAPVNAVAWSAGSRRNPLDNGDLARSFPGHGNLRPTSVLAAAICDEIIKDADMVIDLHSAGLRYSMPLFCGYLESASTSERSRRAALAFGAPIVWKHDETPEGRSLSIAASWAIPAIYAECGGGGAIRKESLDAYVSGVLSVMADLEMIAPTHECSGPAPQHVSSGQGDLDRATKTDHDGFFVSATRAGALVEEGQEIGSLYSYDGDLITQYLAPADEVIMFLRRQARVHSGDTIYASAIPTSGARRAKGAVAARGRGEPSL